MAKSVKDSLMKEPKCPFCLTEHTGEPVKTWEYGTGVHVKRFLCKCGKNFNFYKSNTMTWTIPKSNKVKKTKK
jgi:hypothetical protein